MNEPITESSVDTSTNTSPKMINYNHHTSNSSADIVLQSHNDSQQIEMKYVYENSLFGSNTDLTLASNIVIDATTTNVVDNEHISNGATDFSISDRIETGGGDSGVLLNCHNNVHIKNNNESNDKLDNNNPTREYGKFKNRILKNYALNNNDDANHTSSNESELNYLSLNGSLDHESYGINYVSSEVDVLSTNIEFINENHRVEHEEKQSIKTRRGKAKRTTNVKNKVNKNETNIENEKLVDNTNASNLPSRRRSSRLRNLEKKDSVTMNNHNSEISLTVSNQNESLQQGLKQSSSGLNSNADSESAFIGQQQESHPSTSNEQKNTKKSKIKHKLKEKTEKTTKKHRKGKSKHKSIDKESNHHQNHNAKMTNKPSRHSSSSKENFALPQEPTSNNNNTQAKDHSTNNMTLKDDELINCNNKPEKVKSRWRRNSELENTITLSQSSSSSCSSKDELIDPTLRNHQNVLQDCTNEMATNLNEPIPSYQQIDENIFLFEKKKCKTKKETKKMVCDCILTKEERTRGLMGCGEDCLNRMLMIECGSRCPLGEHCSNKRFQKKQYIKVEPFKTDKKGWGLMALEHIPANTFIMEYVGEVIDPFMFHKRVDKYSKLKMEHYYFMALKSDEIIDATYKGNITRFINHSCEPNAITQKWTVNGELRIGFFTIKSVNAGEEITFDYQFQRYGKKAQKCYCETKSCRGFIGSNENANILTDGSRIPRKAKKIDDDNVKEDQDEDEQEKDFLEDIALDEEIDMLAENGGLRNRQQILEVSRLMLRADKCQLRIQLIDIIMSTVEIAYLRLFLDYHGLQIIWGWMVEAEEVDLKARLLELLEILPIPNKTMLVDSKVYQVVERWAAIDSFESQQYLNINEDITNNNNSNSNNNNKEKSESNKSNAENETNKTEELNNEASLPGESTKTNSQETSSQENQNDEASQNVEKSKTTTDLGKLFGKIVIKSKSKINDNENNGSQQHPSKSKSNVTIGFLAQKLLTHWKDLKEVFRIPRLERQKRHDDEAEADRRAKEEEERRAQGLPSIIHEKRPIDYDSDYTIAGILGNKRCLKSLTERKMCKRNSSHFTSLNIGNNPSSPKLSKEEHRKRFEYNVVKNDYSEALKKYQEQLAIYHSHMTQQFNLKLQRNDNVSGFNELYSNQYSNDMNNIYSDLAQTPSTYSNNLNLFSEQQSNEYFNLKNDDIFLTHSTSVDGTTYMGYDDFKDLLPKYESPLVMLSDHSCYTNDNNISPYAIDNIDFTQIKFENDDCLESMEKRMFDEIYPPAGIFYVTNNGNTYFVSFPDDLSQGINVKENITEPLHLSFTEKEPDDRILSYDDWKYSEVDGHYYYYNKRKQIKQWHPPQDNQIDNYYDPELVDQACDVSHPSTSSSPSSNKKDFEVSIEDLKRKNVRRTQEQFRNKISQFVVKCLNPYMKSSCKKARITNSNDFKSLARKLTHTIVGKEMKQCKNVKDLACTESVKHKTKEYVKRYMSRFGSFYKAESSREKSNSPIAT